MNWLNWKESTSLFLPGGDEPVSEEEVVRRKTRKAPLLCSVLTPSPEPRGRGGAEE